MKKQMLLCAMLVLLVGSSMMAQTSTKSKTTTKKTPAKTVVKKTTVTKTTTPTVSADAIKFEGSDKEEEIKADGKDIHISGNGNKLTITGSAAHVLITGKDNDIAIQSVNEITVTGNGNFVSWEKTGNGNAKPVVQDKGGYNNVGKKSGDALNKSDN